MSGGFPPIVICNKNKIQTEKKEREFSEVKGAVSIKKIMEKRKNIQPFFTI